MPKVSLEHAKENAAKYVDNINSSSNQQAFQWLESKDFDTEWEAVNSQFRHNKEALRLMWFVHKIHTKNYDLKLLLDGIDEEISHITKIAVTKNQSQTSEKIIALSRAEREDLIGAAIKQAIKYAYDYANYTSAREEDFELKFKTKGNRDWYIPSED